MVAKPSGQPTISNEVNLSPEELIASWRAMMESYRPKRPRSQVIPPRGPRDVVMDAAEFEKFRPRRSSKRWLCGAPDYVFGCYQSPDLYYIVFGDEFWTAEYALSNWRLGLDPRLVRCLAVTDPPSLSICINCLPGPYLGRKIRWRSLAECIRAEVIQFADSER